MYKIAVMGDRDSIYGFAALGLHTYPIRSKEEGVKTLKALLALEFAVLYMTEALYVQLEEEIETYRTAYLPAIIPIPGVLGNTGIGMLSVKKSVEQAVGSDIVFNHEN